MRDTTATIFIVFLLFSTLFVSTELVVEKEILPKWYAMICAAVSGIFLLTVFKGKESIHIDKLTICVTIFICYMIVRSLFPQSDLLKVVILISFLLLFVLFKRLDGDDRSFANHAIVIVAIGQGAYGLLQFLGIVTTYSGFRMVGSFDNPAGYAACLAASLPFCFALSTKSKPGIILKTAAVIFLWVCILLSGSRAGILAAGVVTAIYFYKKSSHLLVRRRCIVLSTAVVVSILVLSILYLVKKDSATGRLFIWRVTAGMVAEAPVLGSGSSSFRADYMPHQARYFEAHPDSPLAMLADNVTHPFSEYLSLAVEYGSVGIMLLIIVLCLVAVRMKDISHPYFLCLIAVGIFALFSYPLRYAYTAVLCAYCLATYANSKPIFEFHPGLLYRNLSVAIVVGCCWFTVKDFTFEYRWKQLIHRAAFDQTTEISNSYKNLYEHWNGDPFFLYNYGAQMNNKKQYKESFLVLSVCERYFNDYDVQMLLADNYSNLHQFDMAIQRYELAHNMVPSRFSPLYEMMRIYRETGNKDKAKEMAMRIINMKIKVPSYSVDFMKAEAEKYCNNLF